MRRLVVVFAVLASSVAALPATAQPSEGGNLPCWGFCQLWMGRQDDATGTAPRAADAERHHRHRRWRAAWAYRDAGDDWRFDERDPPWFGRRQRLARRPRATRSVVAVARPVVLSPSVVRPSAAPVPVAAVAGAAPARPPKPIPVVAPAGSAPAPLRPAADIPAAPLE